MLAAIGIGAAMLAACGSAVQSAKTDTAPSSSATVSLTPAQKLHAAAVTIDKNCQVGQPFLKSLLAMQTDPGAVKLVTKISDDAGKICTVAATIAAPPSGTATLPTLDLAAVKTFADSQVPSLVALVTNSSLPDDQKTAAKLAITGAQLALSLAVVNAQ